VVGKVIKGDFSDQLTCFTFYYVCKPPNENAIQALSSGRNYQANMFGGLAYSPLASYKAHHLSTLTPFTT